MSVMKCLSLFGSQNCDINIALTSVEFLWKVTDSVVQTFFKMDDSSSSELVLNEMFLQLKNLCMDFRPEIRHCALNTFFGAIISNGSKLTSITWNKVFIILYELFDQFEVRSNLANIRNEDAIAPELKKGIKVFVHHSRDTGFKQVC